MSPQFFESNLVASQAPRYLRTMGNLRPNVGNLRRPVSAISANLTADYACLWRFLFTASPALHSLINVRQKHLFGSTTASFAGVHVRMGDGARGSAFARGTVPRTDVRTSLRKELVSISCMQRLAAPLSLFVATDNALLKQGLRNASLAEEADIDFKRVRTQGCTSCMANPVRLHHHASFSRESITDIFLEIGLLARAQCLYIWSPGAGVRPTKRASMTDFGGSEMYSQFGLTAAAWAGNPGRTEGAMVTARACNWSERRVLCRADYDRLERLPTAALDFTEK